jgi:outer membrane protein OmpA-like peptidoglycan-associated protein
LDGGIGISNTLVRGQSFQLIIDPKLWLSPPLMVGSKMGINYSNEDNNQNILTFEGQVYMRWNFLRLGRDSTTNIFLQGGIGLLSAYRGDASNPFDNVTMTRGSILGDVALGVTIPLSPRWHIEPLIRGGYPHIWGISLTAGYKFPLPSASERIEYREITTAATAGPPPANEDTTNLGLTNEVVRRLNISAIEFVIFGPDIGSYNVGIDRDAQQLNELMLNGTAQLLNDNPSYRVRIEGHANPYTINRSEAEDLLALSTLRANVVAQQLRDRGVSDSQMIVIAFGGTRNATSEWDVRNRNRRVELMIIQFDED